MKLVESSRHGSIQSRDDASFRTIFEAEASFVSRELRRLGVQARDLPDVAHDVFVAVARRLPDFDRTRPLRPWLSGIARRAAADHRRLARHRREILVPEGCPDGHDARPPADEALEVRAAHALVREALAELEEGHRLILVLHDVEGIGMPRIADDLSIALNTGYSRLRLARAALRRAVERRRDEIEAGARER